MVTDHLLAARITVSRGVAGEKVGRYPAERSIGHGAFIRQEIRRPGPVVGRHREDCQSRVNVG